METPQFGPENKKGVSKDQQILQENLQNQKYLVRQRHRLTQGYKKGIKLKFESKSGIKD